VQKNRITPSCCPINDFLQVIYNVGGLAYGKAGRMKTSITFKKPWLEDQKYQMTVEEVEFQKNDYYSDWVQL